MDVHSPEFLASFSLAFQQLSPETARGESTGPSDPRARSSTWHCLAAVLRPVPVILSLLFIGFQVDGFYRFTLPWLGLRPSADLAVRVFAACYWLLIHIFYLSTSLIDPGTPEPHASSLKGKWCTACKAPKPDRCHHCSTCRRCVLRMDHHCIFTNSCVGLRNQHFFLSFVSLTMFGAGASAVLAAPQVPSALLSLSLKHDVLRPIHLLVLCVTAAVACVCLWNLWMAHMHYLLRNETTIESLRNWSERCESPYDRGVVENVAEVFGPLAKSLPWTLGLLDALDHFLADEC